MAREPRKPISLRLSDAGLERLDELADGIVPKPTRSAVLRALLGEALRNPGVLAAARTRLRGESRL